MIGLGSKIGECESGQSESCKGKDVKITVHYGNMWFCDECWQKEQAFTKEHMSPEAQQQRVDAYKDSVESRIIDKSVVIDNSIQVRTDLFNAATVAILDIKKAIDENPEVTNKPYELASRLKTRFEHFQQVIFDLNEQVIAAGNEQKAIQVYLNQLANSLKAEEREKLKISDINYQPKPQKISKPKPIKTTGTKPQKFDKVALKNAAKELGIAESSIQMMAVSNNCSVEEAVTKIKAMVAAHKG